MEEVKSRDWTDKVYKPDIKDKWDKLYKKPGYDPLELAPGRARTLLFRLFH